MANAYYGINQGQSTYQAVVGSSTNSTDVEINVNLANVPAKEDLILALERLTDFIVRTNYTPV